MAKSNYFSSTHTLQTRPTIDGVQSSVAYSTTLCRKMSCINKMMGVVACVFSACPF